MRFLRKHPWAAAALGFLSVYFFWNIPALPWFFNWNQWFSWAYVFGDHLILPLFNAQSFWLLAKNTARIPKRTIFATTVIALFLSIALIVFFEPDASAAREAEYVKFNLTTWHGIFVAVEFAFIIFMCLVYPRIPRSHSPDLNIGILVALVQIFLVFVFVPDDRFHGFPLWEKVLTASLLAGFYIYLLPDRRFHLTQKIVKIVK